MDKKLPKVFQNHLTNPVQNNRNVYYSKTKEEIPQEDRNNRTIRGNTIYEKIQNMFSSPTYVYKADVEIVLNNGERMVRKVIGSHQGQLITMDNELIPVNQIQDIYFRE